MKSSHPRNLCLPIPRFERINYFYGQLLGVREFQAEQQYFRDKLRLHNRYLHGWGVVCGLEVTDCSAPRDPCAPEPPPPERPPAPPTEGAEEPPAPPTKAEVAAAAAATHAPAQAPPAPDPCVEAPPCVQVECGLALDCCGDEIVVREPLRLELSRHLDDRARAALAAGERVWLWISVCFRERGVEPVRPLTVDDCGSLLPACVHGRLRDDVCVVVSTQAPAHHVGCSPCDGCCDQPCVVLARVAIDPGRPPRVYGVDNGVRRPLGAYDTTRITGVSWVHAGRYARDHARDMLAEGLELRFSAPVRADSFDEGVFDLWAIEGGTGRRGLIYHVDGKLVPVAGEPADAWTRVRYVQDSDEVLQPGDRLLITVRASFLLDLCCRPVDGDHVGGRVPLLPEYLGRWGNRPLPLPPCPPPEPDRLLPWRSGNGEPGGTFESWFWIADDGSRRNAR